MNSLERFDELYGPYFSFGEFRCKCSQCQEEDEPLDSYAEWVETPEFKAFMGVLIEMRTELAFPFIINSGYRCPAYNDEISSSGRDGPHTKGAADIKASFERAYKLNHLATMYGLGIGLNQTGDIAGRYIHVDNQGARLWTY